MADASGSAQAIRDHHPDAISLMDADGQVLYAGAAAAKILGYGPEDLIGRSSFDLLHPQDVDRSRQALGRMLQEPQWDVRTQVRFRQKDGQWRWVESTASNLLDVLRISAIMVIYREIEGPAADCIGAQTIEELQLQVDQLRAFAHTVAHDLREPLRSIAACTELLLRRAPLDSAGQQDARFIVEGIGRMSSLLDQLLASSTRSFKESLCTVNLDDAAAQALENLREAVRSSAAQIEVAPLPAVQGRQTDLIRVFQNLIGNAIKYRSATPVKICITADKSGQDVVIRVHDNGMGIPKEQHRAVFGLFRRLHGQAIPGTGIGLAVCKNIIEGLGGAIWVESEPGVGSTFCFSLAADLA